MLERNASNSGRGDLYSTWRPVTTIHSGTRNDKTYDRSL
ncbi:hypothetical protein EKH55_1653 [Sinorhizobium alkalisoli]|nr:hypothetical protein EKH55_1653 [Sinorhizobium alkalisoli]